MKAINFKDAEPFRLFPSKTSDNSPPEFQVPVRGTGREVTRGYGIFDTRSVVARSALVVQNQSGGLTLSIYPFSTTCADSKDTHLINKPNPLWVEMTINFASAQLPINLPVSDAYGGFFYWKTMQGHVTQGYMNLSAQNVVLVFTRIDTRAQGIWHGRLSFGPTSQGSNLKMVFKGTFAARWCPSRRS